MGSDTELVRRHVTALLEEAASASIPTDVVGRLLLQAVIEIWGRERDWRDIARELTFTAENLDPDTDHEFMRP